MKSSMILLCSYLKGIVIFSVIVIQTSSIAAFFSVILRANEQANLQELLDAFFVVSEA